MGRDRLQFDLSPKASPYLRPDMFGGSDGHPPSELLTTVLRRDIETCRFCGFRSARYQTCVWFDTTSLDTDAAVTACTFCEQVMRVDLVSNLRSGVLIWLPEVSQALLNRAMHAVYALRITAGDQAVRARALLERLMARRETARTFFGTDDPAVLTDRLQTRKSGGQLHEPCPHEAADNGLRLLPLDRRIVREGGLEYNQFPQMLAYWRSAHGPLSRERLAASDDLAELERRFAPKASS